MIAVRVAKQIRRRKKNPTTFSRIEWAPERTVNSTVLFVTHELEIRFFPEAFSLKKN